MKVLLIEIIDEHGSGTEVRYPPLNLGHLAAYGASRRPKWDYLVAQIGLTQIKEIVTFVKPDVIGISFVTQNAMIAIEAVKKIVELTSVPIVAGGQHVTALPWWLSEKTGVNVISVLGEGEKIFFELCNRIAQRVDFKDVLGVGYVEGENYCVNDRPPPLDVSEIPVPGIKHFSFPLKEVQLFTSRGCPFKCTFCSSAHYWQKPRYFPLERVFKEVQGIWNLGYRAINIYDDLFTSDKQRICKIARGLRGALAGGLSFSCLARADTMDSEVAGMLKNMNVTAVAFGLESGNDRVLKEIKGKRASVEQNYKAVEAVKAAGIQAVGSVVYGMPSETFEEAQDTVKMIEQMNLNNGEAYLAMPFPGTPLWDDAENRGVVSEDMDFSRMRLFDWKDNAVIISKEMGIDELKMLRDNFTTAFRSK